MTTVLDTFEQSATARRGVAAGVAVVLAGGMLALALHGQPGSPPVRARAEDAVPARVVTDARPAASSVPSTAPAPASTVPATTTSTRVTPPFQHVPDDPSATVPPPVLGIDPISGG